MSDYRALSSSYIVLASLGIALTCGPVCAAEPADALSKAPHPTVVFMCKYGSVKSLVAAERFNKLAEQQGLSVRAIGRAANPGTLHTDVPEVVARELALEGSNVSNYQPSVLKPEEAASAIRVVHISLQGEPDPDSTVVASVRGTEERWDDVPTMLIGSDGKVDQSGQQYTKARARLVSHVDALFDDIAKKSNTLVAK
jgi:protein-tyrosine-phosphatase